MQFQKFMTTLENSQNLNRYTRAVIYHSERSKNYPKKMRLYPQINESIARKSPEDKMQQNH